MPIDKPQHSNMENNVQFIGVQVSDLGLSSDNNLHGISASFVGDTNRILHGYFYIFNNRSKPEIPTNRRWNQWNGRTHEPIIMFIYTRWSSSI